MEEKIKTQGGDAKEVRGGGGNAGRENQTQNICNNGDQDFSDQPQKPEVVLPQISVSILFW